MLDKFIDHRVFREAQLPSRYLTAEQIDTFNRDGCLLLRQAIGPEQVRSLKRAADRLFVATEHEWISSPEQQDAAFQEYVQSHLPQNIVQDLNDGTSEVLLGFLYRKRSSSPIPKLWHQDGVYWDASDARMLALFTPLTPISSENGPLYFIPGSHRLGRLFHRVAPNHNLVCDITAFREPVMLELEPGDLVALHSHTIHCSPENRSGRERINFGLHFYNATTRVVRNEDA